MELTKIYPFAQESIKARVVEAPSAESEAKLEISFESEPEIPDLSPEELELHKTEKEGIDETSIQTVIEQIRFYHAHWHATTDRPAQEGDYATIDLFSLENGEETAVLQKHRIELGSNLSTWLKNLVLGKNAGDSAEGENELEETADDEAKAAFHKGRYRVTVHSIEHPHLPDVDDELAKKVGAPNVEEMKVRIRQKLEHESEMALREKLREQVEQQLIDRYPFDIPQSLLEKEKKFRIEKKKEASQNENPADIERQAEEESRHTLQLFYFCRKFAQKHQIEVTNQELYTTMMRMLNWTPEQMQALLKNPSAIPQEFSAAVYSKTLIEKVKDYIIDHAKVA